jgi:hypothetical protein
MQDDRKKAKWERLRGEKLPVADGTVIEEYAGRELQVIGPESKMTFGTKNGELAKVYHQMSTGTLDTYKAKI